MYTFGCIPLYVYLWMYTFGCIPVDVYLWMYTCSLLPSQAFCGLCHCRLSTRRSLVYVTTKEEMSLMLLIRVSYFYSGVMSKIGRWTGLDYR